MKLGITKAKTAQGRKPQPTLIIDQPLPANRTSTHVLTQALATELSAQQLALSQAKQPTTRPPQAVNSTPHNGIEKRRRRVSSREMRLRQLLQRYRLAYQVQSALLNLSELASHLNDMKDFYPAIHQLIQQQLHADNFYVALVDPHSGQLQLSYYTDEHHPTDHALPDASQLAQGLTGYVLQQQRPQLLDAAAIAELIQTGAITAQGEPCQYWLGVPICRGTFVIGVMVVQSYHANIRYQTADMDLLNSIATYTLTAIDRVKSRELLEQTVRERTAQLQHINQTLQREIRERTNAETLQAALYKISELTVSNSDMPGFYRQMHHILRGLMKADNCFIALLDPQQQLLQFPFYYDQYAQPSAPRPLRRGCIEYILRLGDARLFHKAQLLALEQAGEIDLKQQDAQGRVLPIASSWLGAPLLQDQQPLGVIALQSYDEQYQYNEHDLAILRFVSQHIATAIQRKLLAEQQKQQQEELERKIFERTRELRQTNLFLRLQVEERKKAEEKLFHEAHHDALTGLANRQMFMLQLRQQFSRQQRAPELASSLLFIDLDRFKTINDSLGHHAGDLLLMEISRRLRSAVREHDVVARLGGDEFVILLTQLQHPHDALEVAARVVELCHQPIIAEQYHMHTGASIGVAHYDSSYSHADALLRDADTAMYQAKTSGRNQVVEFKPAMRQQLMHELSVEQNLQLALSEQAFALKLLPMCANPACTEQCSTGCHCPYQTASAASCWPHDTAVDLQLNHRPLCYATLCWQTDDKNMQHALRQQAAAAGVLAGLERQLLAQLLPLMNDGTVPLMPDLGVSASPAGTVFISSSTMIAMTICGEHLLQPEALLTLLRRYPKACAQLMIGFTEADLLQHQAAVTSTLTQLRELGIQLLLDQFSRHAPLGLLGMLNSSGQPLFHAVRFAESFLLALQQHNVSQAQLLYPLLKQYCQQQRIRILGCALDSNSDNSSDNSSDNKTEKYTDRSKDASQGIQANTFITTPQPSNAILFEQLA